MSRLSETWDDIEALLDLERVEEEVELAVLEALGQLDDPEAEEFLWDDFPMGLRRWNGSSLDERPWDGFLRGDGLWRDSPMNVIPN